MSAGNWVAFAAVGSWVAFWLALVVSDWRRQPAETAQDGSDVPSDQPPGVDAAGTRTAGGRGICGRSLGDGNDNHERH